MSVNKLSKMVNAKNAMSLDWGKMLYEYLKLVASADTADALRESGIIAGVLRDGYLTWEEVTDSRGLGMGCDIQSMSCKTQSIAKEQWVRMGGDGSVEPVVYDRKECRKDGYFRVVNGTRCFGERYSSSKFVTTDVIDKLEFINAMKRFCTDVSACYKDISKCKSAEAEEPKNEDKIPVSE